MKTLNNLKIFVIPALFSLGAVHAQYFVSEPATVGGGTVGFGSSHSVMTGINSAGDVCFDAPDPSFSTSQGWGFTPATPNAPFGTIANLGSPASSYGPTWTVCRSVSTGYAVGYGWDSDDGSVIAMMFGFGTGLPAGGLPLKLTRLTEDPAYIPNSYAYAVNNSGLAVGMLEVSPGVNHAVFWQLTPTGDKGMADISGTSDFVLNAAYGVNNLGQIVGYGTYKSTGKLRGFLYTPPTGGKSATVTVLGVIDTTVGADYSVAQAVNDLGIVVGWAGKKDFVGFVKAGASKEASFHHCFVYSGGSMSDMGVPPNPPFLPPNKNSICWAINNNNEIAGWANVVPGGGSMMMQTAALIEPPTPKLKFGMASGWNNLNMVPLTGLMPGVSLRAAVGINNFGQILAPGSPEIIVHTPGLGATLFPYAFLLTPPPPPPASPITNF
jgi:probable HAF family extracellular repeat protein